ncbi:peptidoglycan DD-metalloendopeptidase family protein [Flaviaesturariibacter aridisoli]|uniref:Peptidase M23 n=1 Tax=Flaviaesturariibacter aridisoli TaxID=2545761 RepID=A0A4R4E7L6_9BACT|nr:peptidoglycan DD-metalloendopeptidase family protein [Flaviaesturariibacter aridisoli]TCZ74810.1 peptidase M23 [Flaviaesturariibacter aridisoli]
METHEFQMRLQGLVPAPVVPLDAGDKLLRMNLTAGNAGLNAGTFTSTERFSAWVEDLLHRKGARYGVGGYNEHRTIYARAEKFDTSGEEPRRLHLGIDIWGPAGTPVSAPLDGIVHSFADNNVFGDYGGTVILQHEVNGFVFHTLYGHLGRASLQGKVEGQAVKAGTQIATFGVAEENGHWPPHLHFQVIIDMQGKWGDYPGVCRYSQRESWLRNCPDPDVLLRVMERAE